MRPMPASSWNWVDAYLRVVYAKEPELYMLRQATMARALLLVGSLDGQFHERD